MSEKKFNLSQTGAQVQEILNSAKSTDQVLTDIQEAMENLPDGQAVSAQVALNTAAIQELDANKASKTEVVFDISAYHATGGVLAEYADLTAALGTNGANIPDALRKGGMSVKFVRSSDNKYVQYRLMADSFTTDTTQWAIADEGVYVENPEFVYVKTDKDDKILWAIRTDGSIYYGAGCPQQVKDYIEEKISSLSLDEYEDIVAFLSDYLGSDTTLKAMIDSINERIPEIIGSPEFLEATTDSENKVLEGIQADGTKVIGGDLNIGGSAKILGEMEVAGVTYKVIQNPEYLAAWIDAEDKIIFGFKADGKTYVGDADFLDDVESIKAFLANFNSKNIDWDALTSITATENPEYIEAKTDSEGKILAGRTADGAAFENVGFSTPKVSIDGHIIKNIEDLEGRSEITTDADGKIISYRDIDGVKHENVGIESKSVTTNSLNLSPDGMTEFQQALRDSKFRPGGAGDYTDKDSMYISEPRLAHLNIISDVNLLNLSKEGTWGTEGINYNVPITVEFVDDKGNYFKKYALLSGQGRSSLNYIKKGLGMDFFNEDPSSPNFNEDNVFEMKFGDWIYQDSFHIKSYYTDWSRCTTPVVYKLADEVVRTRGVMNDRPYKKYYVGEYSDVANANTQSKLDQNMETGARCFPDGFPVIVYQNGEFWGVNAWQLKKHRDNYMLSKKKDTNIHLDGDMGVSHQDQITPPIPTPYVPFWLWNGTIDWTVYCSGVPGIETRNPKNLYCVDGKKYNADTHDVEIINTATAEDWIDAGVITPTGKTIDEELAGYLRTTGKVRKAIEDLTTYIPTINQMIEDQATASEIRATIEDMFDVDSFIDYIVINNVVGNVDAWDNNGQIVTWGKLSGSNRLNWSVNIYDCDFSFGYVAGGTHAQAAYEGKLGLGASYPLYTVFWNYYFDEMKARYHELRDKGIFDANHIIELYRDWMNRVGYDNYKKEYQKWSESPCFRDGSQTYTNYPTTGGMYDSIYRIYLWIKKRIEFMDAANFFNYNQN